MTVPRQLRVVDADTGEVTADLHTDACPHCFELERDLRGKRSQLTRMKNELATALGLEPEAQDIMDVLDYWRMRCMPKAKIVVGSERWLKVRQRLRERDVVTKQLCYTPLGLKAAVVGALLSPNHVENKWLDAVTIFRDSATTDKHIARAISFKRRTGTSALEIVDDLAGTAVGWLADHCRCDHTWLMHLRGGPRPDGTQPCSVQGCGCQHFDTFHAKVDRWMKEHETPPEV